VKQLVQDHESGDVRLEEVPTPVARRGQVLVRAEASLVSAGTDRQTIEFGQSSLLEKARARPDLVRQVLDKARADGIASTVKAARARLEDWLPLGYSLAGRVLAVGEGVMRVRVGDRVACAGQGFASHAEVVAVPESFVVPVPEGVEPASAAFATLGAIALHGIHRAGVKPGDSIGVIGLGLVGQLTVQLLAAYGNPVFGVDVARDAAERAREAGAADTAVDGASDEALAAALAMSGGRGLDAVIITASTPSSEPIANAARLARKGATICVVGLVGMEADRRVFYEKELSLVLAKSYGPGRDDPLHVKGEREYPADISRWSVARNMEEFLRLCATGRVRPALLRPERVPLDRAPDAYARLLDGSLAGRSIVIEYAPDAPLARSVPAREKARPAATGKLGVAFLGAGDFARGTLAPAFARAEGVELRVVAGAGGLHAAQAARKFGFARATSDLTDALADDSVRAVVVATRHDLHAKLAADALRAGKAAYVEKPLALTEAELADVLVAQRETDALLHVGFNRRFAPLVRKMREHFAERAGPMMIEHRVNAGKVPVEHWTRDATEGGGRILGEVCHFVDTVSFLAGERPVRVLATGGAPGVSAEDHLVVALELERGSRAVITYTAAGPARLPKERIECIAGWRAAVLDNYRALDLVTARGAKRVRALAQDKGHAASVAAFVAAARDPGLPAPMPLDDIVATTLATLAIPRALASGAAAGVDASAIRKEG
jgi:predicted dehydrogenase